MAIAGLPFTLEHQVVMLSQQESHVRIPVGKSATEIEFLGRVRFNYAGAKERSFPRTSLPGLKSVRQSSTRTIQGISIIRRLR